MDVKDKYSKRLFSLDYFYKLLGCEKVKIGKNWKWNNWDIIDVMIDMNIIIGVLLCMHNKK